MRHHRLLGAMGLLIGLCSYANADVLCREPSGSVVVRGACRKAETQLNMAALGLAGSPGPKGEKGERGPRGQQGRPGDAGALAPQTPEPVSAGDTQTRPLWWQVWLMLGTLIVVGFYTIETSRLRREAQRQTELQLRPFVIFEPAEGKQFCVRNIGNNTALNVKVGTFVLFPPAMATFPRSIPFLPHGESRALQGRTVTVEREGVNDDFLFEILRPGSELEKSEAESLADSFRPTMRIEFENIQGQRYFVQESLLNGDIEILDFGPVTPPASDKVRSARQRLQTTWQQLEPTLRSAWQQFKSRKRERVNAPTANEEKEWVDGR